MIPEKDGAQPAAVRVEVRGQVTGGSPSGNALAIIICCFLFLLGSTGICLHLMAGVSRNQKRQAEIEAIKSLKEAQEKAIPDQQKFIEELNKKYPPEQGKFKNTLLKIISIGASF